MRVRKWLIVGKLLVYEFMLDEISMKSFFGE